ncbi:MAG: heavy metal translocating P-type ATPase [Betaproteobacteria bacterium]|nr:heavy metal translocating P-type ATPase [Betaproteobacteria bacterium]
MSSDTISSADSACYHCGLPVPPQVRYYVSVDGKDRSMCCAGCEAAARLIVDNGLSDYYRRRDAMPEKRPEAIPEELRELGHFDHPEFQQSFVRPVGEHERETSLILEGITCAACMWLNERHVALQPGVSAVQVNYATRRVRVRWDDRRIKLSDILGAIQSIGYRAYPYDAARAEDVADRERRTMLWRVFVAGFGMMQVMMYAVPGYIAGDGDMTLREQLWFRWASLILTLPVVLYSAAPFFKHAVRDFRLRRLGMDVPVALGVGSAFLASMWATLSSGSEVYFDSVTMFVFFLLGGRYLEMLARARAVRGIEELGKVLPAFSERLPHWPLPESEQIPVSQLVPGDCVRVRPGGVIPADGTVVDGVSETNEALLTGESRPVPKKAGSALTGGSINISSPLVMRVEQVGDSTRLAAVRRLMERASAEKPKLAALSDRWATVFVIVLLTLAVATGIGWYFIDPLRAFWVFVSVLVVACPCALSLATPAALTVATDALARMGVLVTRGHAIETLARVNHYVFDKTGTLTTGRMRLEETLPLGAMDTGTLHALASALEQGSEHPVAAALRDAAAGKPSVVVSDVTAVTGHGMTGHYDGGAVWIGRPDFVAARAGLSVPDETAKMEAKAGTVIALASEHGWLGLFRFADALRPAAADMIRQLAAAKIPVTILSGDALTTVAAVGRELEIADVYGAMTPQDKQTFIAHLQENPAKVVAMIGDGVNDAPVLAQAHVSVAMGSGTDLARNQADIVLLGEDFASLGEGASWARKTLWVIRQNLCWAAVYNLSVVPLAMMGRVTPLIAGVGMAGSSLLVVLNALRLQRRQGVRE